MAWLAARKGVDIVKDMGGGFLQKLTEGRQSSACFVMGALVNKWTHVNIPLVVSTITGQDGQDTRYHRANHSRPVLDAGAGSRRQVDSALYVAAA